MAANGYFKRNSDGTIDAVCTELECTTVTASGNATVGGNLTATGNLVATQNVTGAILTATSYASLEALNLPTEITSGGGALDPGISHHQFGALFETGEAYTLAPVENRLYLLVFVGTDSTVVLTGAKWSGSDDTATFASGEHILYMDTTNGPCILSQSAGVTFS